MESMYYIIGSGFVGSHLKQKLSSATVIHHNEIGFVEFLNPDRVFYLASYGNLFDQTDVGEIIKANLTQPLSVMTQMLKSPPASFIYVSTSSVLLSTQTPYSTTKYACELVMKQLAAANNFPLAIVRPFSITGVGEQPCHLIPTLIEHATSGEVMDFVPSPTHDFIDVDDVVEGLVFIADKCLTGTYELGNGTPYTNEEVKHLVEQETDKQIKTYINHDLRPYDTYDWYSKDDSLYKLGFHPTKTLRQSIKEMVEATHDA